MHGSWACESFLAAGSLAYCLGAGCLAWATVSRLAAEHVGSLPGRRAVLAGESIDGRGTKFEVSSPGRRGCGTRQDGAVLDRS